MLFEEYPRMMPPPVFLGALFPIRLLFEENIEMPQ
jgi:hypothetical protein